MLSPRSAALKRILAGLAELPLDGPVLEYLAKRGLAEVAVGLKMGRVPDSPAPRLRQYAGRLVIPSLGPDGDVYDVAFRCIRDHDCKVAECPKYLFLDGLDKRLYNLRAVTEAVDTIEITEGQLDAATLEACGLHAVGVPGAHGWKKHHPRLFQGYDRVRVWGDGDVAGKEFAKRVCNDVAGADVMMVPFGQDINEVFVQGGKEAVLAIAEGEDEDDAPADEGWGFDSERPPY